MTRLRNTRRRQAKRWDRCTAGTRPPSVTARVDTGMSPRRYKAWRQYGRNLQQQRLADVRRDLLYSTGYYLLTAPSVCTWPMP